MARLGASLGHDGRIDDAKIAEVADIVAALRRACAPPRRARHPHHRDLGDARGRQRRRARRARAARGRAAALEIIDEDEEARLAFVGALASLDEPWEGEVGVVDVGGGSTEIVVGSAADGVGLVALLPPRLRPPEPTASSSTTRPARARSRASGG